MNFTVTLSDEMHEALAKSAERSRIDTNIHGARIIEDFLLAQNGLVPETTKRDVLLARSLIERAIDKACTIVETDGFVSSITFDAIQSVSADKTWLDDYRTLVRDDPYKTGNPRKQTINQNLGYFIKKALGARSQTQPSGRPINVKVKGSIIQSYTPLMM